MSRRTFTRANRVRADKASRRASLRARRAALATAGAAGAFALAPAVAHADFQVNTLNDAALPDPCDPSPGECTLRGAIEAARSNAGADTITFATGLSGTIHLSAGALSTTETAPLTISGPGSGVISVSGDGDDNGSPDTRVLAVNTVSPVAISGLTITEGNAAGSSGGGLNLYPPSYPSSVTAALNDLVVTGNSSVSGGGIRTSLVTTVTNSTVSGNNTSSGGGAGILAGNRLNLNGSTVSGNTTTGNGGGISASGKYAPVNLANSVISGNSAATGGGVLFSNGGIKYDPVTSSSVVNTTIAGNHATTRGAGMQINGLPNDLSTFKVQQSTIANNDDPGTMLFGGGIDIPQEIYGAVTIVDSTIAGNKANTGAGLSLGEGGTRLLGPNGHLKLDNSTIAGNQAVTKGAGIYLGTYTDGGPQLSGTVPLTSTIVADNIANGAPQDLDRVDGSTTGGFPLAFSLVEAPGDAPVPQTPAGASLVGTDPQLGPLAANGGPTQTQLPSLTSPVLDKGQATANLSTDQRGLPRTVDLPDIPNAADGTDMGAVEIQLGPAVKIDKGPKKKVKTKKKKQKVQVSFSSEPGASFECSVDGSPFKACSSPLKVKLKSRPGKGKPHKIEIRAKGGAGTVARAPTTLTTRVIRKPKKH